MSLRKAAEVLAAHGRHDLAREIAAASLDIKKAGLKSMTFGKMPSFHDFEQAFEQEVPGSRYSIRNHKEYSGQYTARELYDLVNEIKDDWDETNGDEGPMTASSIMETLGFEWI